MKIREQYLKLIDKKQQEIKDLELQIEKARAYVQAFQEALRYIPKDGSSQNISLRPGSALYETRELLRKSEKPLHINEILKGLNRPLDKKQRVSLSGNLSSYVRKGQVFTRTGPNTFGLTEFSRPTSENGAESESEFEIPEEFGSEH